MLAGFSALPQCTRLVLPFSSKTVLIRRGSNSAKETLSSRSASSFIYMSSSISKAFVPPKAMFRAPILSSVSICAKKLKAYSCIENIDKFKIDIAIYRKYRNLNTN